MRDGNIFKMNQQRAENEARLYRQFGFLNTRMEAFEKFFCSTWNIVKAIFRPQWAKQEIDKLQLEFMKIHDDMMKQAVEEAKKEQAKPKIQIVTSLGTNGK